MKAVTFGDSFVPELREILTSVSTATAYSENGDVIETREQPFTYPWQLARIGYDPGSGRSRVICQLTAEGRTVTAVIDANDFGKLRVNNSRTRAWNGSEHYHDMALLQCCTAVFPGFFKHAVADGVGRADRCSVSKSAIRSANVTAASTTREVGSRIKRSSYPTALRPFVLRSYYSCPTCGRIRPRLTGFSGSLRRPGSRSGAMGSSRRLFASWSGSQDTRPGRLRPAASSLGRAV
jgi:hypothetical protein